MNRFLISLVSIISVLAVVSSAYAADTSTATSLPYEDWLKTIQKSLTGPVAFSVSIIGIVSCGVTLIFTGGEITRFMRSVVYLVFVLTLLVGANSFMSSVFNGAMISQIEEPKKESREALIRKITFKSTLRDFDENNLSPYFHRGSWFYEQSKNAKFCRVFHSNAHNLNQNCTLKGTVAFA